MSSIAQFYICNINQSIKNEIHKVFLMKFVHKQNFMYICIVIKTKRYGKRNQNATGCKTYPVKIVI